MPTKRLFSIFINGGAPMRCRRFTYSYSQTKEIVLLSGSHSATIEMRLATEKDEKSFGRAENPYYVNALERALWTWLVVYGHFCSIEEVAVSIDGAAPVDVFEVSKKIVAPVQPATNFSKRIKLPREWGSEAVLKSLLSIPRTKEDHSVAAVTALCLSKVKKYQGDSLGQTERFMYLWMAMNGYYNRMRAEAFELNRAVSEKHLGEKRASDRGCITLCLRYHGYGIRALSANERASIAGKAKETLMKSCQYGVRLSDSFDSDEMVAFEIAMQNARVSAGGKELVNSQMHVQYKLPGFFLFELPYYYRCNLLHANRPIPLFVKLADRDEVCLTLLSDYLEVFLDDNLWRLFDEEHLEGMMRPRINMLLDTWDTTE